MSLVVIGQRRLPVPQTDHDPAPVRIGGSEAPCHFDHVRDMGPLFAHHSTAPFDMTREFTVSGVVTKFL